MPNAARSIKSEQNDSNQPKLVIAPERRAITDIEDQQILMNLGSHAVFFDEYKDILNCR